MNDVVNLHFGNTSEQASRFSSRRPISAAAINASCAVLLCPEALRNFGIEIKSTYEH